MRRLADKSVMKTSFFHVLQQLLLTNMLSISLCHQRRVTVSDLSDKLCLHLLAAPDWPVTEVATLF